MLRAVSSALLGAAIAVVSVFSAAGDAAAVTPPIGS
jgi:hypothetical protein